MSEADLLDIRPGSDRPTRRLPSGRIALLATSFRIDKNGRDSTILRYEHNTVVDQCIERHLVAFDTTFARGTEDLPYFLHAVPYRETFAGSKAICGDRHTREFTSLFKLEIEALRGI